MLPELRRCLFKTVSSLWFKLTLATTIIWLLVHFNRIDIYILLSLSNRWPWLLAAFIFTLPPFLIVSYRFKLILSSQSIETPFRQALHWTMVGAFFDLAMPSSNGGDLMKAGCVIKHVGAGFRTRAVMAVAFDRVIGLLGLFLLASIVGVIGRSYLRDLPARDFVIGMSFALGVGPLIVFRMIGARCIYNNPHIHNWLLSRRWGLHLKQLIGSFNALRENPRTLFAALGLSIVNHVFWCTSLLVIAIATGNVVAPLKGFTVFPLAIFGGVFGFAGGFGIGTAAFDFFLSHLLLIHNGALIGLLFQIFGLLSRLTGLPFYLTAAHSKYS